LLKCRKSNCLARRIERALALRIEDDEVLKMVVTYLTINEPERRCEIFELAEKHTKETYAPPISQGNIDKT
jgi:hypothetical protein